MSEALGAILGSGVGVALSPLPIIAVILMLATPSGRRNGAAFALGWVLGLSSVAAAVLVISQDADEPGSTAETGAQIVTLVVGMLFLWLALRQWRQRPRGAEEASLPSWMAGLDASTLRRSLGLGVLLSALNPKNLAMCISFGVALSGSGASSASNVVGTVIFVIVGSTSIVVPVLAALISPSRSSTLLTSAKAWMVRHNTAIMMTLFLVLGATRVGEGIASLSV